LVLFGGGRMAQNHFVRERGRKRKRTGAKEVKKKKKAQAHSCKKEKKAYIGPHMCGAAKGKKKE